MSVVSNEVVETLSPFLPMSSNVIYVLSKTFAVENSAGTVELSDNVELKSLSTVN